MFAVKNKHFWWVQIFGIKNVMNGIYARLIFFTDITSDDNLSAVAYLYDIDF